MWVHVNASRNVSGCDTGFRLRLHNANLTPGRVVQQPCTLVDAQHQAAPLRQRRALGQHEVLLRRALLGVDDQHHDVAVQADFLLQNFKPGASTSYAPQGLETRRFRALWVNWIRELVQPHDDVGAAHGLQRAPHRQTLRHVLSGGHGGSSSDPRRVDERVLPPVV